MKENFLRLVRLGIGTETVSGFKFHDSIDWGEVEALAAKQGLLAVVLDGVQRLAESAGNKETIHYKKNWNGWGR